MVSNSFSFSIAESNSEIAYCEAIVHAACKKLTDRVAQKEKMITVCDIGAKITKLAETEVKKARKVLDETESAELKKENAKITM